MRLVTVDMDFLVLSEEALLEIKEWFAKCSVEINLAGEDLVLYAEYQRPEEEGSPYLSCDAVGWIRLQDVIAFAATRAIDDTENQAEARARLFAIAGLLKELARRVEKEAEDLNFTEWSTGIIPTFMGTEEVSEWQQADLNDNDDTEPGGRNGQI